MSRILIIEDEEAIADLEKDYLELSDFEVHIENNGEDGLEGAHYKNVFGTYSHGPLLPKNPDFADLLIKTALERKYGRAELGPLDDTLERAAHDEMCRRLEKHP